MTGLLATTQGHAGSAVNVTAVLISVGIPLVVCGSVAVIIWAYFRLQAHRADAVAMASYQKLAEEAVQNQIELRTELAKLADKVDAVERLMREVG
jgi:predicted negative regulator of RcsB-dependent stress response